MKLPTKLLLVMFLLFPAWSFAELPQSVELDFAVLDGYVIMSVNDEYVVDLDGSDQLYVGDILTLVKSGDKIIHPVTKQILGAVDIPLGFLQVTRINSGYSYAKPLSADLEIKPGAKIKRFEQVPAYFDDNKGDDGVTAGQIMMDLPQFKWLSGNEANQALLTFQLTNDSLDVKSVQGNYLHNYKLTEKRQLVSSVAPVQQPFVSSKGTDEPNMLQQAANKVLGLVNLNDENPVTGAAIVRQKFGPQKGVWMSPNIAGHPVGLVVADLDGDGLQETALALVNKLLIGRIVDGKYTEVAELEIPSRLQTISIDALDLDKNGRSELYLTAIGDYKPASMVVEFNGTEYAIVIDDVRWFLRSVVLPGQDEQTLVGQDMANDTRTFYGSPFRVSRDGNSLVKGEELKLPGLLNIYSFMPLTDEKQELFYAHLTMNDYLKVLNPEGTDLWESSDYFGGSESCFANREETVAETVIPACVRPRMIKTPDGEILVVQNDGQRLMQRYRIFKQSRILALKWNGFALVENWRTPSQQGYLGDIALADADNDGNLELVMAVKFKHEGLISEARTAIVVYEMQ